MRRSQDSTHCRRCLSSGMLSSDCVEKSANETPICFVQAKPQEFPSHALQNGATRDDNNEVSMDGGILTPPSRTLHHKLQPPQRLTAGKHREGVAAFHPDSLVGALRPALVVAQLFSLLPVKNAASVLPLFWWCSFRVCCSLFVTSCFFINFSLAVNYAFATGLAPGALMTVMFWGSSLGTSLLFLQLSTRWPALSRTWAKNEAHMRRYGYPKYSGRNTHVYTAIALFLATVEHILAMTTTVIEIWPTVEFGVFPSIFEAFSRQSFKMVFYVTQYAHWKGIALYVLHVFATLSWNYADLFIMLLSVALANRFQLLNKQLTPLHGVNVPGSTWRELRESYNSLASLTRTVDACISKMILFSLASNLCFICHQLLEGIIPKPEFYQLAYYFGSFGYLIARTFCMMLCAASVHSQSRIARAVLYAVPTESYCEEVGRFLAQVTTDDVFLTGCGFFSVTRSLILAVAGTIMTYEIVLVQFNISEVSNEGTSVTCTKTASIGTTSNITLECYI